MKGGDDDDNDGNGDVDDNGDDDNSSYRRYGMWISAINKAGPTVFRVNYCSFDFVNSIIIIITTIKINIIFTIIIKMWNTDTGNTGDRHGQNFYDGQERWNIY